jgi:hypothetical protein
MRSVGYGIICRVYEKEGAVGFWSTGLAFKPSWALSVMWDKIALTRRTRSSRQALASAAGRSGITWLRTQPIRGRVNGAT